MSDTVPTRRLAEIMVANFIASAFVATPIGIMMWYAAGAKIDPVLLFIMCFGWPLSWGMFSAGRAWQRNRSDVLFPEPLQGVLERLGLAGEMENFVSLLYLPGVQVPACHHRTADVPTFLR